LDSFPSRFRFFFEVHVHPDIAYLAISRHPLAEDQPGLEVDEEVDAQIIIHATGELQVEIICERLAREHHLCVERGAPKVIYLETIRETSAAEGNYITQSGASTSLIIT
jgi:elongation factor G